MDRDYSYFVIDLTNNTISRFVESELLDRLNKSDRIDDFEYINPEAVWTGHVRYDEGINIRACEGYIIIKGKQVHAVPIQTITSWIVG